MTSFDDPRRGYDDRFDIPDWQLRQGRPFDPRDRYHQHRFDGDWMRELPWPRDWPFGHADADFAPMVKVIDVFAQSPDSWEDATRRAVVEASQTIRGIRSISIEHMYAVVDDDQLVSFRINAKIAFVPDEHRRR